MVLLTNAMDSRKKWSLIEGNKLSWTDLLNIVIQGAVRRPDTDEDLRVSWRGQVAPGRIMK